MARIILRDEGQILKKAKINELEFGLKPNREKIGSYRSYDYAQDKNIQNPLAGFGNVDLIRTGAFSNSLFPVRYSGYYLFDSGDSKTADLKRKYGKDIMGLNQNTFNVIQEKIYRHQLAAFIKKQLGQHATSSKTATV